MKGKKKYIVPLLLAGMTTATGIVTTINQQQQSVVRADVQQTSEINDIASLELRMKNGFKSNYQVNESVTMPEVEVVDGTATEIVYTIKRGSKQCGQVTVTDVSNLATELKKTENLFKPDKTGAYDVTIEAKANGKVASKIEGLKIIVSKADASIVLPTNSKYVIPAQLPTDCETFKIPQPKVVLNKDDGSEKEVVEGLVVAVIDTTGDEHVLTVATDDSGEKYYAVDKNILGDAGTYQIRYTYKDSETIITSLNTNFQVVEDLDLDDIDLRMKLSSSSIPSSGNVNTDITLPKVTALENKDATDGINAHITVKYRKETGKNTYTDWEEIEDYENYTFHPTEMGNYQVCYQVDLQELYGKSSSVYYPETIIKVSDKKNPVARPTASYTVTDGVVKVGDTEITSENSEEKLPSVRYEIPSVVCLGSDGKATITLPAIYAEDNWSSYSKLKFTRGVYASGTTGVTKKEYKSTDTEYKANETITHEFTVAGNYEIRYIAEDENGNTTKVTYAIVVKESQDEVKDSVFNIKMNIGLNSITDVETLSFVKPTATDTYDSYLNVETYYDLWTESKESDSVDDVNARTGAIDGSKKVLTELKDLKDGKYSIKMAGLDHTAKYIRIVTVATRDAYLDSGNTIAVEKWIKINKASDDVAPAVFGITGSASTATENWNAELIGLNSEILIDSVGSDAYGEIGLKADGYAEGKKNGASNKSDLTINENKLSAFNQGKDIITLPAVTFKDADENLKISVTIYDNDGNRVNKVEYEDIDVKASVAEWLYTISGIQFKLSTAGMYTVTYRAEDVAGHVTVKTFGIRVNDTTAPTIVIDNEDKFGETVELGEFFEVPTGTLIKNGQYLDEKVTWQVEGGDVEKTQTGFYAKEVGTYYIRYSGADSLENEAVLENDTLFFINVKDTKAPVIDGAEDYSDKDIRSWSKDTETSDEGGETVTTELDQMTIRIPDLDTATDPNTNETIDVDITLTGPDGTVKVQEDGDGKYFIAKKQGKYTLTYVADDGRGNNTEFSIMYELGDCVAPTISWKNNYKVPSKVELDKNGEGTLELDLSNLVLKDNVTTDSSILKDSKHLTIKLMKPDGSTEVKSNGTPNEVYKYTLTETGTYTLQITVKDEAGNSKTEKFSIEVPSEDADTDSVSPVVGTILIVVSVVILAGVVIYFVVSSRKKTPAKAKASRSKKK